MTSDEAEKAAAAHGVNTQALSRHVLHRQDVHGLLLGFAAFSERAVLEGVVKLARALERDRVTLLRG